ncbi:MAG: hypothetical protein M1814_002387 [Vezdaea aestivalis]|nr:MAG: hypothetical protein M1814_002387 [Vezdaea aestivalis]
MASSIWISRRLVQREYSPGAVRAVRHYAVALEQFSNSPPPPPPPFPSQSSLQGQRQTADVVKAEDPVLKRYKPSTPGRRHLISLVNKHLWKGKPHRPLTYAKKGQGKAGRNNTGQITVRHRGGGHARRVRTVDFQRSKPGKQTVDRIEYDPNRSAHIALVTHEKTQEKSYILAPDGLRAGDVVESFRSGLPPDVRSQMGPIFDPGLQTSLTVHRGNCLPLYMIPLGTSVFNVGLEKHKKGKLCRSAGTYATVISRDVENTSRRSGKHVTVKLQSGEIRKVSAEACATIGVSSNIHYNRRQLGKAGRSRWLGIRPTVRGVAMNACDHPHGGGRGKSKGNRIPTSPWGVPDTRLEAEGTKTNSSLYQGQEIMESGGSRQNNGRTELGTS